MLRVWILEKGRAYRELDAGPFPIDAETFLAARREVQSRMKADPAAFFGSEPQCNQTAIARPVLHEFAPSLSDFDVMALGYAMTSEYVRIQEGDGGRITRC
jgi:hypothetical protein